MRPIPIITIAAGLLSCGAAFADVNYTIDAGVGHSDNMARTADGEIDETIATAGVLLRIEENRPRFTADVNLDARYFEYLDDTFESEVVGAGDAFLEFGIVPERFTWMLQDSYGQERSDPFTPVTPETREDVNFFSTGPQANFRLGSTGIARLLARYSNSQYEVSPLDGHRFGYGFAIGRQMSARSELAFNGFSEQIRFADAFNTEYDRDSFYLSYRTEGARTRLAAEAGYTMVDLANGEDLGDPLFELELTRDLSPGSALTLELGTRLTDASDALRSAVEGGTQQGGGGVIAAADPYKNSLASLTWSFTRNRTSLSLGGSYQEDEYETAVLFNRKATLWSASVERSLRPTLTVGLTGTLRDEEFEATGLASEEMHYGLTVSWQFARTLGLRLLAERFDRDTSDATGEFKENRAFLTIFFRPGTQTATR